MNTQLWIKRFVLVLFVGLVGYFLVLHAGMSTDQDEYLKWYYKLEFVVAGVLCWSVSLYLGLLKLLTTYNNVLGLEVGLIHITGYFSAFKLYDIFNKT